MFCRKCGNEITEGDKFCTKCGTQQFAICPKCNKRIHVCDEFCVHCGNRIRISATTKKADAESKKDWKKYTFNFSTLRLNDSKRDEINTWLKENPVIIHQLNPTCYMNVAVPGKYQASLQSLDVVYEPAEENQNYYFEYASVYGILRMPTEKLQNIYDNWKNSHPEYKVIWEKRSSFQTTSGLYALSLFVLCKKIK